jgi:AcrR family transcriptional regulator
MTKGADTRDRIVDQAFRVATVEGLGGVTLGRLAADVGMSKSGLFAHFRSKEELQLEVLRVAAERFRERVVRPALAAPRGEPRVRAVFERWMAWTADEECMPGGCLFAAAGAELDDQPGVLRDALAAAQQQWFEAIARVARTGVEAGHFRPALDAEQFAFELYGIMFGYYHARRLLRDPRAEERARRAFDALVASVSVQPGRLTEGRPGAISHDSEPRSP